MFKTEYNLIQYKINNHRSSFSQMNTKIITDYNFEIREQTKITDLRNGHYDKKEVNIY